MFRSSPLFPAIILCFFIKYFCISHYYNYVCLDVKAIGWKYSLPFLFALVPPVFLSLFLAFISMSLCARYLSDTVHDIIWLADWQLSLPGITINKWLLNVLWVDGRHVNRTWMNAQQEELVVKKHLFRPQEKITRLHTNNLYFSFRLI